MEEGREGRSNENKEMGDGLQFPSDHCLENEELMLSKKVLSFLMCAILIEQFPSERSQLLFLGPLYRKAKVYFLPKIVYKD